MTRLHVSPISGTGALIYRSGNALAYLVGVPVSSLDKVAGRLANAEPVAWMAVLQAFQVTGAAVIDESNERTRLRYTGMVEIQVLNGSPHPNEPDGSLYVGTDDVRIMHLAVDDRLRINPRPDAMGIGNLEGGSMAVDSLFIRVGEVDDSVPTDFDASAAPGPGSARASIPLPPVSTLGATTAPTEGGAEGTAEELAEEFLEPDPTVFHVPLRSANTVANDVEAVDEAQGIDQAQVIDIVAQAPLATVDVSPPDSAGTPEANPNANGGREPSGVFVVGTPPSASQAVIVEPPSATPQPEDTPVAADESPKAPAVKNDEPTTNDGDPTDESADAKEESEDTPDIDASDSDAELELDDDGPRIEPTDSPIEEPSPERTADVARAEDTDADIPVEDADDSPIEDASDSAEALDDDADETGAAADETGEAADETGEAADETTAGADETHGEDTDDADETAQPVDEKEDPERSDDSAADEQLENETVSPSSAETAARADSEADGGGEGDGEADAGSESELESDGTDTGGGDPDGGDEATDADASSTDEAAPANEPPSASETDPEKGDRSAQEPPDADAPGPEATDESKAAEPAPEPGPTIFLGASAKGDEGGFDAPYQPSFKKVPLITKANEAIALAGESDAETNDTDVDGATVRPDDPFSAPDGKASAGARPSDQTCVNGHRNSPTAAMCSTCGERLNAPAQGGRVFMRPGVVGTLTFDDGEQFDISNDLLIGRAPGTPVIGDTAEFPSDPMMSREHFRIEVDDHSVVVRDLNSSNGTMVRFTAHGGYERLVPGEAYPLSDGAVIVAGQRWATFALHLG